MNLLRLFITAQWPAQDTGCEWELVDGAGKHLQRGRSEPRHWPAADECELVLGAEQCMVLHATLPKGAKSRLPEVVSYALEDHLIGDAENDHFVIGGSDADGRTAVWVISRARLKGLLTALNSVGRAPRRAYCEIQLAPWHPGSWSVCLRAPGESGASPILGFARTGSEDGFAFDVVDAAELRTPPLALQLALQTAQAAGKATDSIALHVAPGTEQEMANAIAASWQAALAIPVAVAGEFKWHEHAGAGTARNLLMNEFAPPRRPHEGWGNFRLAALLALLAGIAFTIFTFGEWAWLTGQRNELRQQMAATFRSAFPQSQALVDPPLQMQRLYEQMRRQQGQLGAGDFLPLLAAASESIANAGRIAKLGYDDGRLEITAMVPDTAAAQRMLDVAKARGMAVTLVGTQPAKSGVEGIEATFSLRSAP